jgi:ribosome-associated protein
MLQIIWAAFPAIRLYSSAPAAYLAVSCGVSLLSGPLCPNRFCSQLQITNKLGIITYFYGMKAKNNLKFNFDLNGQEFIELNKLLKILSLVGTGGEANVRITQGEVLLNGATEWQKRKKIRSGDIIIFDNQSITVK